MTLLYIVNLSISAFAIPNRFLYHYIVLILMVAFTDMLAEDIKLYLFRYGRPHEVIEEMLYDILNLGGFKLQVNRALYNRVIDEHNTYYVCADEDYSRIRTPYYWRFNK